MLTYRVILTFLTACVTERGAGRRVCSVRKQFRIQRDSKVHKALSNRQSPVLWQMNRWCWILCDAWKWQLWWWWDYGIPLWLVPRLTGLGGAQWSPAYVVPWSLGQWSPINIHKYPHCLYIVVLSSTTCSWAHLKCTLLSCSWWFENADKSRYWETPLIWFCCKIGNAIKEPLHQVQYSSVLVQVHLWVTQPLVTITRMIIICPPPRRYLWPSATAFLPLYSTVRGCTVQCAGGCTVHHLWLLQWGNLAHSSLSLIKLTH